MVLAGDGLSTDLVVTAARRRGDRTPALPPSRLPCGARLMAMPQSPRARVIVGVDTGGTFTDITPAGPAHGPRLERQGPRRRTTLARFGNGIGVLRRGPLRRRRRPRAARHDDSHQPDPGRQGAPAALITTTGFRHVLEIAPGRAAVLAGQAARTSRPTTSSRSADASARTARELQPLDAAAVRAAARAIRQRGIGSIAVVRWPVTPTPPRAARRAILAEAMPDAARLRSRARCCPCSASTSAA